jgi:aryl-alcohol dehydrogenase-like predicted oxidoreductase
MQFRKLGNGPLEVSELSFGTWLTVAGGIGREQAIRCIHAAIDHGITLFDTANQYGAGEAERVLGEALRSYPRDRYLIATKLYFPVGDEPDHGLSAAQIEKQLDRSLQRLGVDTIDLYQCHRFDKETPLEETLTALDRAVRSGKARAIGFSEWTAEQIEAASVLDALAKTRVAGFPGVRSARDWKPCLLSACPRGTHREIRARSASAARQPRSQRADEHLYGDCRPSLPVRLSA